MSQQENRKPGRPPKQTVRVKYEPHRLRRDYADPKDPNIHVHLVADNEKAIQRAKRKGYEFVRPEELQDHDGTEIDNVVRFDDRIAMKCSRTDFEMRRKEMMAQWKDQEQALEADADFQARDGYAGGGLHTYPEHGRSKSYNIPLDIRDDGA